ncbi:E3 ubiquitin-protein ligase CHFR-like isoform X2 [Gigantopelta aegis]|nr:E3 ubiquitin-protein ligase CHFR-like isoform X2 [Gigantopelta aegis]
MSVKLKGEKKCLQHGDEFFVVFKKNHEHLNIGYMYQDMEELAKEDNSEDECTQEYEFIDPANQTLIDEDLNLPVTSAGKHKRTSKDEADESPPSKKLKPEKYLAQKPDVSLEKKEEDKKPKSDSHEKDAVSTTLKKDDKEVEEGIKKCNEPDKEGIKKCNEPDKEGIKKEEGKKEDAESDSMAESLMCIICQEILHDCISLQPCMHSFCAGCYSDWMAKSNQCPSCRLKVDRINKNHIVSNLVEAFLKEHPDKKRPEEDIKELEKKNKITRDMLYPTRQKQKDSSDGSDSEDYTDSDDYTSPTASPTAVTAFPTHGLLFGLGTPVFGTIRPPKTICRQCPEWKDPSDGTLCNSEGIKSDITVPAGTNTTDTGSGPSNSGVTVGPGGDEQSASDDVQPSTSRGDCAGASSSTNVTPVPPKYVCTPAQNHVLCQCCLHPMPDRRQERMKNPPVPPQQCTICYRAFCHAYWGCRKIDCLGCLAKFKEFNFGNRVLASIVLDNAVESNILKDHLDSKGISVKDMLLTCLQKLESGKYSCVDQSRFRIDSNTVLCYPCGLRNFKDLAYLYRRDIPSDQLPDTVNSRPDCYWGKNCRTQRNKPHHATRFNHICDQTRTM